MTYPMNYDFRTGKLKKRERAAYIARMKEWWCRIRRDEYDYCTIRRSDFAAEQIFSDTIRHSFRVVPGGFRGTITVTSPQLREYREAARKQVRQRYQMIKAEEAKLRRLRWKTAACTAATLAAAALLGWMIADLCRMVAK